MDQIFLLSASIIGSYELELLESKVEALKNDVTEIYDMLVRNGLIATDKDLVAQLDNVWYNIINLF